MAVFPHRATEGVAISIWLSLPMRSMSAISKSQLLPFRKPLYASPVGWAKMNPELVANPSNCFRNSCSMPCPPPMRATSMKIPQNTPKAVSRLRVLLRVMVTRISSQVSLSIFIMNKKPHPPALLPRRGE